MVLLTYSLLACSLTEPSTSGPFDPELLLSPPAPQNGEVPGVIQAALFPSKDGVTAVVSGGRTALARRWSAGAWSALASQALQRDEVPVLGPGGDLAVCRLGECREHGGPLWTWSTTAVSFGHHGERGGPSGRMAMVHSLDGDLALVQSGGRGGRNLYVWDGAMEHPVGPGFRGSNYPNRAKDTALSAGADGHFAVAEVSGDRSVDLAWWQGDTWLEAHIEPPQSDGIRASPFGDDPNGNQARWAERAFARAPGARVAVAFDGTVPHVAWLTSEDLRVRRFHSLDEVEDLPSPVDLPGAPRHLALAVHDGSLVVAWSHAVQGDRTPTRGIQVRRFDGSRWVPLGPAGSGGIVDSPIDAVGTTLAVGGAGRLHVGWIERAEPTGSGTFVVSRWSGGAWEPLGWQPSTRRPMSRQVQVVAGAQTVAMSWVEDPRIFPQRTSALDIRAWRDGAWTALRTDLPGPRPDEVRLSVRDDGLVAAHAQRDAPLLGYSLHLVESDDALVPTQEAPPSPSPEGQLRVGPGSEVQRWTGSNWETLDAELCVSESALQPRQVTAAGDGRFVLTLRRGVYPAFEVAACTTGGDRPPELSGFLDATGQVSLHGVAGIPVALEQVVEAGRTALRLRIWDRGKAVWLAGVELARCHGDCASLTVDVGATTLCAGWLEGRAGGQVPALACLDLAGRIPRLGG